MDGGGHGGGHHGGGHHGGGHGGHGGGHGGYGPGGIHGGGGPAREQPAGVRLTRCDDQAIVAESGWNAGRHLGLLFLAVGLLLAATGLWSVTQPEYAVGSPFLITVGLVFATSAYLMLQPGKLEIDVASRTYEERLGWGRLCTVRRGGWGDRDRLVTRKYRAGAGGTDLLLYWENMSRPPVALFTGTEEAAARLGRDLARAWGWASGSADATCSVGLVVTSVRAGCHGGTAARRRTSL